MRDNRRPSHLGWQSDDKRLFRVLFSVKTAARASVDMDYRQALADAYQDLFRRVHQTLRI